MDNGTLDHKLFMQREFSIKHKPYNEELKFYEAVKSGDVAAIEKILVLFQPDEMNGYGTLSKDSTRNLRYHFIVLAAMITRFCTEGGMEYELAYSLSDLYIQKMDVCNTAQQIQKLHDEMIIDYTKRMRQIKKERIYSKQIVLCIDYIYENLHNRIKIAELAQTAGINESYLSKLFKRETGMTVSDYIRWRKVEAAQSMLKYTEHSYSDIAEYLAFSSQSHFIEVFHKATGLTPKEYRNQYFRRKWID